MQRFRAAVSEIRRIGIIGAGQMGRGIAHVCALAGLDVLLTDVSRKRWPPDTTRSTATCRVRWRAAAFARRRRRRRSGRIGMAADYAAFGDCDMVIEAATEKEAVKREIFTSSYRR